MQFDMEPDSTEESENLLPKKPSDTFVMKQMKPVPSPRSSVEYPSTKLDQPPLIKRQTDRSPTSIDTHVIQLSPSEKSSLDYSRKHSQSESPSKNLDKNISAPTHSATVHQDQNLMLYAVSEAADNGTPMARSDSQKSKSGRKSPKGSSPAGKSGMKSQRQRQMPSTPSTPMTPLSPEPKTPIWVLSTQHPTGSTVLADKKRAPTAVAEL